MTLYHNTSNNLFSVLKTNYESTIVTITDEVGTVFKKVEYTNYKTTIDINDLSHGIYKVTAQTNQSIKSKQIIIQ